MIRPKRWSTSKHIPYTEVTLCLTNWTFGVWWDLGTISRHKNVIGVDVGPFAVTHVWKEKQSVR